MTSLSASSLEVVRYYAAAPGGDAGNNKFAEALENLLEGRWARSQVRCRLPRASRAWPATCSKLQEAEKYINEALRYLRLA